MWSRANEPAPSLRRRLLWLVLAAIAVASAIQAATAYRMALRNADALFDLQLQQFARSVEAGLPPGGAGLYEFEVQVWGPDGVAVYATRSGPATGVVGLSDAVIDGVRYRIYLLKSGGRTIQVAQDLDARRARARALAWQAVLPVAVLAPLLMLAVWWLVARSFAPVERIRRQIGQRAPQDLAPLPQAGLPREVLPLVQEFNTLLARVEAAFASQRHFVSDAAHELRSPLTALKLQAEALRELPPGPARDEALQRLATGTERAIRLVGQLLALAREENVAPGEAPPAMVDLQALCRAAVSDVLPLAMERSVDVGVQTPQAEAGVHGDVEALRILLRNLLENAIKFAPRGGRVDISLLARPDGTTTLRVEDNGPGIPAAERKRVFDRFYRGHGDVPGSGLGLAIVRAIAQRHGAAVRLEDSAALGGLQVDVVFPPAA